MIQLIAGSRALHSAILKMSFGIQEIFFSLFSPQNLTFKYSLDTEINQEDEEARDSRIEMSKQYDYLKYPRMLDIIEEHVYL